MTRFHSCLFAAAAALCLLLLHARPAFAQNPVQWSGNIKGSISHAADQSLPLLVWVKDGQPGLFEDDDLEDAQEDSFRDPAVVNIIRKRFIPLRVSRNSRTMEIAKELGLPTGHGLYCAVITHDGRLLGQMGPGEVADPRAFAAGLHAAFAKFAADLYERELRAPLTDLSTPKPKVRRAAQTVWRLGLKQADSAIIGLLARPDLTSSEKGRIYELLASLGTPAAIAALLERAGERPAASALNKAEPGALPHLLAALPPPEGDVTEANVAAAQAVASICKTNTRVKAWWDSAKAPDRTKEIERLRDRAATVLDYWKEREGITE